MQPLEQEPEPQTSQPIPHWVSKAIYVLVPVAAAVLIVLHTAEFAGVQVDTTTIGLLALLLLVPLAPYIRRLSAGGVEAEIGSADARQLQAAASELPPATDELAARQDSDAPTFQELIDRDPPLGLAQLRIEIEKELRRVYSRHFPDEPQRRISLGVMANQLHGQNVLTAEVAEPLGDVIVLANRAIHGEYVPTEVASEIGEVGLRILAALQQLS